MKVLIVGQQLRRRVPGGIGTYVRGLIAGMSSLDRRPTVWASRVSDQDPLQELPVNIVTTPLPGPLLTRAWDHGLLRAPGRYDIVHATSLSTPPARDPLTVMVHDLAWRSFPDAFPWRGRRWHEASLQRAMKNAAKLIVPSTQTANGLRDAGVALDRIEVVPHGHDHLAEPDHDAVDRILEAMGLNKNATFLLTVGTREPRKNLSRLLGAYERIRGALPEPWPLIVVGPVGWGRALKPVEGATIVTDAKDSELAALYERCHLLAYVPLLEGYGFPVVEAMSKGVPVVASSVPAAGEAALLVDPLNTAAIAEGLLRVATDGLLRADLIRRSREHARRTTWRASALAHVRIWESLS